MMRVYIEGIGVMAPGLTGWEACARVLRGEVQHAASPLPPLKPSILPNDLRRRTTRHILLALEVAAQAVAHAERAPQDLPAVFASSEPDGETTDNICSSLFEAEVFISPTRFHNSVNNAAAGYWAIATGCRQAMNSVVGYDGCFAVGLLEAAALTAAEEAPALLVVHNLRPPDSLFPLRPIAADFGIALVLNAEPSDRSLAALVVREIEGRAQATHVTAASLEALRQGNPAAAGLPLLTLVAGGGAGDVLLPYVDETLLRVRVEAVNGAA